MERLSLQVQTAYAELIERLTAADAQRAQVIRVLSEDRPGDLRLAWHALAQRGWTGLVRRGVAALERRYGDAARALASEIGDAE
jgi:hypothetical protein